MKITDAMRRAAAAALIERYSFSQHDAAAIAGAALTAALADVPETLQHRLRAEAYEELSQAQFRIADLEAKLDKVRTWAAYVPGINAGLLAILDGREDP